MADPMTLALAGGALARTVVEARTAGAEARNLERRAAERAALADARFAADRREAERDAAALRARFAAGGVALAGTPLLVLEDAAAQADYRARLRRFETLGESADLRARAARARSTRAAALLGAGRDLLSGLPEKG